MPSCTVRKQTKCDKIGKICNPESGRCIKRKRKISIDLNLVNVNKLREMATGMKVKGRSKMNKAQLVASLKSKKVGVPKQANSSLYNSFIAKKVPSIMKKKNCTAAEAMKIAAGKWHKVADKKSPSPKRKTPSPKRKTPSPTPLSPSLSQLQKNTEITRYKN